MKNDKKPNPVIAKAQVSPRPARDTERRESLAHRKIDRLERDRERHPHTPTLARQWADPADTAALAAAHQRLVDVCEPAQASPIIRDERTMAEAVAEIRTRGPQPPLDYVQERELLHPAPAQRAALPVLLAIVFLAGVLVGMGL